MVKKRFRKWAIKTDSFALRRSLRVPKTCKRWQLAQKKLSARLPTPCNSSWRDNRVYLRKFFAWNSRNIEHDIYSKLSVVYDRRSTSLWLVVKSEIATSEFFHCFLFTARTASVNVPYGFYRSHRRTSRFVAHFQNRFLCNNKNCQNRKMFCRWNNNGISAFRSATKLSRPTADEAPG